LGVCREGDGLRVRSCPKTSSQPLSMFLPCSVMSSLTWYRFQARIITWFRSFLMTHTPSPADAGPVILLVCHAAYLKTLISVLTSKVFSFTVAQDLSLRGHARNTSVTRVRCSEHAGGWKGEVESWCEVGHLDGMFEKDVRAADVV